MRAGGSRFVFVIDCSRSMRGSSRSMPGTRWDEVARALTEALERLSARQSFYVIFFDGESHPMFDDRPPELGLLPADEASVERLATGCRASAWGLTRGRARRWNGLYNCDRTPFSCWPTTRFKTRRRPCCGTRTGSARARATAARPGAHHQPAQPAGAGDVATDRGGEWRGVPVRSEVQVAAQPKDE